jgi:hypothetical protein
LPFIVQHWANRIIRAEEVVNGVEYVDFFHGYSIDPHFQVLVF